MADPHAMLARPPFKMHAPAGSGAAAGQEEPASASILVRVAVPEQNLQKMLLFDKRQTVWTAKQRVLERLAKNLVDAVNYGLYLPPAGGRAGKFLNEERMLGDYALTGPVGYLEFKYKRRVYLTVPGTEKTRSKLHTRASLRKFFDLVSKEKLSQVKELLARGTDPNFHDESSGETPLTLATASENVSVLIALVEGGAHMDFRARSTLTPVHTATLNGNHRGLKTLLDLGASPDFRDGEGLTAMYHACMHGSSIRCAEILLKDNVQLHVIDKNGWTELHQAARFGHVSLIRALLLYGANIDHRNYTGNSALHICAAWDQAEAAEVLLKAGASTTVTNRLDETPLVTAKGAGSASVIKVMSNFDPADVQPIRESPAYYTRHRAPSVATDWKTSARGGRAGEAEVTETTIPLNKKLLVEPQMLVASSSSTDTNTVSSPQAAFYRRTITIHKGTSGFGFRLVGASHSANDQSSAGQCVRIIDPGSPAHLAGLLPGDRLMKVNGTDVLYANHRRVVDLIVLAGDTVILEVGTPQPIDSTTRRAGHVPVAARASAPSMLPSSPMLSSSSTPRTTITLKNQNATPSPKKPAPPPPAPAPAPPPPPPAGLAARDPSGGGDKPPLMDVLSGLGTVKLKRAPPPVERNVFGDKPAGDDGPDPNAEIKSDDPLAGILTVKLKKSPGKQRPAIDTDKDASNDGELPFRVALKPTGRRDSDVGSKGEGRPRTRSISDDTAASDRPTQRDRAHTLGPSTAKKAPTKRPKPTPQAKAKGDNRQDGGYGEDGMTEFQRQRLALKKKTAAASDAASPSSSSTTTPSTLKSPARAEPATYDNINPRQPPLTPSAAKAYRRSQDEGIYDNEPTQVPSNRGMLDRLEHDRQSGATKAQVTRQEQVYDNHQRQHQPREEMQLAKGMVTGVGSGSGHGTASGAAGTALGSAGWATRRTHSDPALYNNVPRTGSGGRKAVLPPSPVKEESTETTPAVYANTGAGRNDGVWDDVSDAEDDRAAGTGDGRSTPQPTGTGKARKSTPPPDGQHRRNSFRVAKAKAADPPPAAQPHAKSNVYSNLPVTSNQAAAALQTSNPDEHLYFNLPPFAPPVQDAKDDYLDASPPPPPPSGFNSPVKGEADSEDLWVDLPPPEDLPPPPLTPEPSVADAGAFEMAASSFVFPPTAAAVRVAVAQEPYECTAEDELSFQTGDVIELLQTPEVGGWWEGSLNGVSGWFPCKHVFEYHGDTKADRLSRAQSLDKDDGLEDLPPPPSPVGVGAQSPPSGPPLVATLPPPMEDEAPSEAETNPESWLPVQVADWVDQLGFPQYRPNFEDNDIHGRHLLELSKDDLKELEIQRLGHRMTIFKGIEQLRQQLA
eukprot:m.143926 g.143926  ORF g.143926 m.143926 type:complete len:1354 (-) comp17177_c1_seq1:132-4193(-)